MLYRFAMTAVPLEKVQPMAMVARNATDDPPPPWPLQFVAVPLQSSPKMVADVLEVEPRQFVAWFAERPVPPKELPMESMQNWELIPGCDPEKVEPRQAETMLPSMAVAPAISTIEFVIPSAIIPLPAVTVVRQERTTVPKAPSKFIPVPPMPRMEILSAVTVAGEVAEMPVLNPPPLKVKPLKVVVPLMNPSRIVRFAPKPKTTLIAVPLAGLALDEMVKPLRSSVTSFADIRIASPLVTAMLPVR